MSSSPFLQVTGIRKSNENGFHLSQIHFTQSQCQKLAIAGETGSGKSTLLKIIGGLLQPDAGTVLLKNERVKGPDEQLIAGHPAIAYLSQHFELRNHYRVEEELDYVNKLTPASADIIFELCKITHLLKRRTTELSGGERQRVSLTRVLLSSPSLLLLDEPYSNLDLHHKQILKKVIRDIGSILNITVLMVSHDAGDILPWAEKILIIKNGTITEQGTPQQLYKQPASLYTAGLLGKYNVVPHTLLHLPAKESALILIRPEDCYLTSAPSLHSVEGLVKEIYYYGYMYEAETVINGQYTIITRSEQPQFDKGEKVFVTFNTSRFIWPDHGL